jgi:hypothetical protein
MRAALKEDPGRQGDMRFEIHGWVSSVEAIRTVARKNKDQEAADKDDRRPILSRKGRPMNPAPLNRTRRSLFYLVGYLLPTGIALLLFPAGTMRLLLSNGHYDDVFPRVAGLLLIGLGLVVAGIIRYRTEVLYPVTLIPRLVFCVGFVGFYLFTRDPLFLVILAVVGFGMTFTGLTYLGERSGAK